MDINNKNTNNKTMLPQEISQIIRDVITQIFALFGADNFLVLFPRMDLKGFG
ncbi:DUF792 family protein, partial [Borreliella burgdorferi]